MRQTLGVSSLVVVWLVGFGCADASNEARVHDGVEVATEVVIEVNDGEVTEEVTEVAVPEVEVSDGEVTEVEAVIEDVEGIEVEAIEDVEGIEVEVAIEDVEGVEVEVAIEDVEVIEVEVAIEDVEVIEVEAVEVADDAELCAPCEHDDDCFGRDARCLAYLDGGFCGRACDEDGDCPEGFMCVVDDVATAQCWRASGVCSDCFDPDHDGHGQGDGCLGRDCDEGDAFIYEGAQEVCNARDDDCDGVTDEGELGGGARCVTGLSGVCQAGELRCSEGRFVCAAVVAASSERCDGLDNDCNGSVDDGSASDGATCDTGEAGVCGAGTMECRGGGLRCAREVDPVDERCNGLDDDCNGVIDDGDPEDGAACRTGALGMCDVGAAVCEDGRMTCVPLHYPVWERCNGSDDDCDGWVDDYPVDAGSACDTGLSGRCGAGTEICEAGVLQCRPLVPPLEEACNGLDDDCDGWVDEGNPGGGAGCFTGGLGECRMGALTCFGGQFMCMPGQQPSDEVCNALDDDCDGLTDDGNPGGGEYCHTGLLGDCGPGHNVCQDGAFTCVQDGHPNYDSCNNGRDEDCDGRVDPGCPVGITLVGAVEERGSPMGGQGGDDFQLVCPDGQVLVGVRARTGDVVDRVQAICRPLVLTFVGATYTITTGGPTTTTGTAGGEGGREVSVMCSTFVTELFVWRENMTLDTVVSGLRITCGRVSWQDRPFVSSLCPSATDTHTIGQIGANDGLGGRYGCDCSSFAKGLYGRSGTVVDALGISCQDARLDY